MNEEQVSREGDPGGVQLLTTVSVDEIFPSPEFMAHLKRAEAAGATGPLFIFDPARRSYLFALFKAGKVVSWDGKLCPDAETAQAYKALVLDELNAMHEQAFKALLPPELLADLEAARKIWKDDARAVGHSLKECDRGDIDLDPALEVAPDQRTKH